MKWLCMISRRSRCAISCLLFLAGATVCTSAPAATLSSHVDHASSLQTPLEASAYKRLSTSDEIADYVARLDQLYRESRVEVIGHTVQGRPIQALVLSNTGGADVSSTNRVTVEIIGGQHGTETAGAESLLFVARDLLAGPLRSVLKDIDVVLIPNANADGRDNHKRVNANAVNLNVDFVAMTQPESRALAGSLQRFRPEVVLDVHESAVLKRKSLAREGYMTDFSVQVEYANNPNVAPALQVFSQREILAPWIGGVNANGYVCHRYIGEIRSHRQPITNGGLSLNNFRNRAGLDGAIAFLVETRLDPKNGGYPTFHNIRERVKKQRVTIGQFLQVVHRARQRALRAVAAARPQAASMPLALDPQYVAGVGQPRVSINLRRIADGKLQRINFADHRTVATDTNIAMPAAYVVRDPQGEIAVLLSQHGIAFQTVDAARDAWGVQFVPDETKFRVAVASNRPQERMALLQLQPGDLWVSLDQPRGRLAALILEPASTSSIFLASRYSPLFSPERPLPVYRVPR